MQNTQYYNLIKVEGSDIVNPLTQMNPNWDTLDSNLRLVGTRALGNATETVSGTVHNYQRGTNYAPAFRFIAIADWHEGDTATVDGVATTVIIPDGSAPGEGAYKTGASIIGIYVSGTLTLMVSNRVVPAASEVTTTAGDSVQDELDSLGSAIKIVEGGAYTANDTWVLPQEAADYIATGKEFIIEADFYFGDTYSTSRVTKVTSRGFGGHVTCAINRSDIQVGLVRITQTSFESHGFDLEHKPVLRNLYMFPLGTK